MKNIVIFGATSEIARHTAIVFAEKGANLLLAARNTDKLEAVVSDLETRTGKKALPYIIDANDFDRHETFFYEADKLLGGIDGILIAHGTLPEQEKILNDTAEVIHQFNTNAVSVVSLCTAAGKYFEQKGKGVIAVISSVAGDRGRGSNYIYGAAKAGVSAFLSGLRNRFFKRGINVVTIKPGFVDTPMTADVPKNFLFAKPRKVAEDIYHSMEKGRDVVYTPWFWRYIMMIIKLIPEGIFKKLGL